MSYAVTYIVTLVIFAIIDTAWLGTMASRIYRPLIGEVLADQFRMGPAVVFYCFYAVGIVVFAVSPALKSGQWTTALVWGALFGLFAYGTYDLTNWATMKGWGGRITAIDMAWGTFVTALSAVLATFVAGWIIRALGLAQP